MEMFNFYKNTCVTFQEIFEGKREGFLQILTDFIAKSSCDLSQMLLCKCVTIILELKPTISNCNMWNKCLFERTLSPHLSLLGSFSFSMLLSPGLPFPFSFL